MNVQSFVPSWIEKHIEKRGEYDVALIVDLIGHRKSNFDKDLYKFS